MNRDGKRVYMRHEIEMNVKGLCEETLKTVKRVTTKKTYIRRKREGKKEGSVGKYRLLRT